MSNLGDDRGDNSREINLLKCLCRYLRAYCLYPANNVRVTDGRDSLLTAIQGFKSASTEILLQAVESGIEVGDPAILVTDDNTEWLGERFQHTGISGLIIKADIDGPSLDTFVDAFLKNIKDNSRDRSFSRLWGETYSGAQPLERRFIREDNKSDPAVDQSVVYDAPRAQMDVVVQVIGSRSSIQKKLSLVAAAIGDGPGEDTSGMTIDIAALIARVIPPEAFDKTDLCAQFVEEALAGLQQAIRASSGENLELDQDGGQENLLKEVTQAVGHRVFGTFKQEKEREAATKAVKRKPDRKKPERREENEFSAAKQVEFLECLAELPQGEVTDLCQENQAEQLGIALFMQGKGISGQGRDNCDALCRRILSNPTPEELLVFVDYLKADLAITPDSSPKESTPILALVQRLGMIGMLKECGLLSPEVVAAGFPDYFLLFIDGLDARDPVELNALNKVCRQVGGERLLAAGPELVLGGILNPGRANKILDVSGRHVLPLVKLIMLEGTSQQKDRAIAFLKAQRLDQKCATPLRLVDKWDALSENYLNRLFDAANMGNYAEELFAVAGEELRKYIRDTVGIVERDEVRSRVATALVDFPSEETQELLEDLAAKKGFLGRSGESRPVREAAGKALQLIAKRRGRGHG